MDPGNLFQIITNSTLLGKSVNVTLNNIHVNVSFFFLGLFNKIFYPANTNRV